MNTQHAQPDRRSGSPRGVAARAVYHNNVEQVVEAMHLIGQGSWPLDVFNAMKLTTGQQLEVCRRVEMMRRLTL